MKKDKKEYAVKSINNFIDILELLGNTNEDLSINDISIKLSLTKGNTAKLLNTLEIFEYVECNRYTGNYKLGVKAFQISQAYRFNLNIVKESKIYLERIRDNINEKACISVLRDNNIVFLDEVDTTLAVRVASRLGNVAPAYATSAGKIYLAYMDDESIKSMFPEGLTKITEHTITSFERLFEELKNVRRLGYATDNEEFEEEVVSFAVPVINFLGSVGATLCVSIPKIRITKERIDNEIVPTIKAEAKELSRKCGYKLF